MTTKNLDLRFWWSYWKSLFIEFGESLAFRAASKPKESVMAKDRPTGKTAGESARIVEQGTKAAYKGVAENVGRALKEVPGAVKDTAKAFGGVITKVFTGK
jgi:hypothetical protein